MKILEKITSSSTIIISGKKQILLLSVGILFSSLAIGQSNSVGVRAGVGDPDIVGDYGMNLELFYEKNLFRGLSVVGLFGVVNKDEFPEYFEPTTSYTNGVPTLANEEILNLSRNEAFLYGYERNNVEYLQALLKYKININLLKIQVAPVIGLMLQRFESTILMLDDWTSANGQVVSYTPRYTVGSSINAGYTLGFEINRELTEKYFLSAQARYNIQFQYDQFQYPILIMNVGFRRVF